MNRWLIRLALVTLFGITLTSVPLKAICVTTTPDEHVALAEEFTKSAVVFVGRAITQEVETATEVIVPPDTIHRWTRTITTFEVEEVWKGPSGKTVRVRTCGVGKSCSVTFEFQIGSRYLVFASGEPLQTSRCNSTALVERAGRTLEWLADKPRTTPR
jgi:hypothetical protein